jgi:hypothetical protein
LESILDRVQKLFDRGFLIAAFVPSIYFVLCSSILYSGFHSLTKHVGDLAAIGWKENIFELGVWLLVTYLLAYVLYGTRQFLQRIYEGDWHITVPFQWLWWLEWLLNRPYRLGIWLMTHRMRCYKKIADEKVALLDWEFWVLQRDFGETFSRKQLCPKEATQELSDLEQMQKEIKSELDRGQALRESDYCKLLARAHVLRANLKNFENYPQLKEKINRFVDLLRCTFNEPKYREMLKEAVARSHSATKRAWQAAQSTFLANFPDDERWMRATQLGMLAAVNDLYPYRRYGITLSNLWPRLIQILPEDTSRRITDANIYVDFTMVMSFLSAMLALGSAYLGVIKPALPFRNFVAAAIFFFASFVFYYLTIQARRGFGTEVQAAVDLFRRKLMAALDIDPPSTLPEERNIWEKIHFFIQQADLPDDIRFSTGSTTRPDKRDHSLIRSIGRKLLESVKCNPPKS